MARWAVRFQQYDFKVVHRKGRDHIVPDTLSRAVPVIDAVEDGNSDTKFEFVDDRWYCRMLESVRRNPLKFAGWRETNGRLWKHSPSPYPELSPPVDSWKLVVPKRERPAIVTAAHEPPTSGHVGVSGELSSVYS